MEKKPKMRKKTKTLAVLLSVAGGVLACVYGNYKYQEFYHSPEQVQKRQEELYAVQREALAADRKLVASDAKERTEKDLKLYFEEYPVRKVSITSGFSKEKNGYLWEDCAVVTVDPPEDWEVSEEWQKLRGMELAASQIHSSMSDAASADLPDGFDMSYEEIADSPEDLKCYGKSVEYRKIVDLTVADQAEPRRLTYTDTKDLYQDEAYYIAGEKQDVDAIQASRYEENKENNKKADNRGTEYPETPIYDGYGTDQSSTPTVSPPVQSRDEDEYHVNDYDDPEDFYEDNADDFEDEEDAEDYYDEYHE